MSRILLIYPPSRIQYHQSCPMGIQLLGAVLQGAGHEISLLDANAAKRKLTTPQIVEHALRLKPDVIGITLLTPMIREAYVLARRLKEHGFTVLGGGPHATLMPQEGLEHGFDAVVIGEGESAIEEAVQALLGKIPKRSVAGWAFRDDDGSIVVTEPRQLIQNLDLLPLPARHLVDSMLYGGDESGALHCNLFSSRGCTARCSFCSGHLFGKKFRFRSAQNILDEIEHLQEKYGTPEFHFVDDAMTLHRKRLAEFCQGIADRKMNFRWTIMTRIDAVNEEFLRMIREAGCYQIDYGVESGDPVTLRRIHKPHTVDMVRKVIPLTARMGIDPYVFFILGFPWEDAASLDNTLSLMKEIAPHVANFHPAVASILIPFPGTEIYEQFKTEYQFENWWLSDERNYDEMIPARTSYYESKIFHLGNILKANFFRYDESVRKKIYEIFEFMHLHNLSMNASLFSRVQKRLLMASKQLQSVSVGAERLVFRPVSIVESGIRRFV